MLVVFYLRKGKSQIAAHRTDIQADHLVPETRIDVLAAIHELPLQCLVSVTKDNTLTVRVRVQYELGRTTQVHRE